MLFLSLLAVAAVKSYHDLEAARQRKLTLETRIRSTQSEIARLQNRIERLRSDPGLLERLAREDLGMVRPGDVVIELPLEDVGGTTPAPVQPGPVQPAPLQPSPAPSVPAPDPATLVPAAGPAKPSASMAPAPMAPTPAASLPAAAPAGPGGPADPPPGTP